MLSDVVVPTQGVGDLAKYAIAAVGVLVPIVLVIWFLVRVWQAIPKWLLAVIGAAAVVVLLGIVRK